MIKGQMPVMIRTHCCCWLQVCLLLPCFSKQQAGRIHTASSREALHKRLCLGQSDEACQGEAARCLLHVMCRPAKKADGGTP